MAIAIEARKAGLVRKAEALVGEMRAVEDEPTAKRVIAEFYEHVPPADVAERSPRELCGAALALLDFAKRRRPGKAKIRAYNPDPADDGWSSPHTIVEIVNDDMPFLVDSVTAAINASDRVVHLVIHPIFSVRRGPDGRLSDISAGNGEGVRESWMHVEITAESDPAGLAELTQRLDGTLAQVRAAVADWSEMREVLRRVIDELASAKPPLAAGEIAEARDFLRWLEDDNFTFLGYREYPFGGHALPAGPALGILRDEGYRVFGGLRDLASLPPDVQEFVRRRELLIITKSDRRSNVHRSAHMDAIGLRRFDAGGEVVGVRLFLGLFTSLAYSRSPRAIPVLRVKVRHVVERSGLSPASHDGKALFHILDSFPRDELFQADEAALFATVIGILDLQERQRIALFVRKDPLERFVSCLVYVPRERYDTPLRQRFAALLAEAFKGEVSAFYTHLDDSVFARIQFIVRTTRGAVPAVDVAGLEARLAEAGRSWTDRLEEAASAAFGEAEARRQLRALKPFPPAYQARTGAVAAVADLVPIGKVLAGSPLEVALHPRDDDAPGLRIYRAGEPVVLSDILPIIENLGLRVVAEEPFRIESAEGTVAWVHELALAPTALPLADAAGERLAEALVAVWTGRVDNDGFNRLVASAGLSARQVVILRLYGKILRQAGSPFSQAYIESALSRHPEIARRLVRLFEKRFDPEAQAPLAAVGEIQAIEHGLNAVESLDEDRILRSYLTLVLKTLRTNYFQRPPSGAPKPYL
ncbi:MAG TPA: NAD-glutamate dehydrogenase domain-containing protein, partial [Stellaceae bacterium]|nr:NAD-glutamate dehydrogenase domain-containing protein [Stellaceae bacterium]